MMYNHFWGGGILAKSQTGSGQGKSIVRKKTRGDIKTDRGKEQCQFGVEWWRQRVLNDKVVLSKIVMQSISKEYCGYCGDWEERSRNGREFKAIRRGLRW